MCEVGLGYIYAYLSLVGLLCFGLFWCCVVLFVLYLLARARSQALCGRPLLAFFIGFRTTLSGLFWWFSVCD